jgi:hypothetical protein
VPSKLVEPSSIDKINQIDQTQNSYGFIGNRRKPFTILVWLASKGVPKSSTDATAGYFFYQTQDGFNFRSIDGLITQEPRKSFNDQKFSYTLDSFLYTSVYLLNQVVNKHL